MLYFNYENLNFTNPGTIFAISIRVISVIRVPIKKLFD